MFKKAHNVDAKIAQILAATARLEEHGISLRRDVQELKTGTVAVLSQHAGAINSLQRSRANFRGWIKGVSIVSVLLGVLGYFGLGE